MSKHGTKRGRPSLGPSPPAPKRANVSHARPDTSSTAPSSSSQLALAAAASSSTNGVSSFSLARSTRERDLPGPATVRPPFSGLRGFAGLVVLSEQAAGVKQRR